MNSEPQHVLALVSNQRILYFSFKLGVDECNQERGDLFFS